MSESDGRQEYLKWLREDRKKRLADAANRYETLPANIRAAIAKVAGVENVRLDEQGAANIRKLNIQTRKLIAQLVNAHAIIASVDVTVGLGE